MNPWWTTFVWNVFLFFFLLVPGIDGGGLADASLTDSYFSTSFIGVNGFGSPAETKYPMMQVMAVNCVVFH